MKKCRQCGEKFKPIYSSLQIACSPICASKLAKVKEVEKRFKEMKIVCHEKDNKKYLQAEINKLSKMIDHKFNHNTCIDCGKFFGKQIDAAHYHSRGANSTLRYNLHNLHSASSQCNQFSENHKQGYSEGLRKRYGEKYFNYVVNELPIEIKEIKLSAFEVVDKLKIVRRLIRDFNALSFENSIRARSILNKTISIYD